MEANSDNATSQVVTGWDLKEFKRTDGTEEEQKRRKEVRAEAREQWKEAAAQRGPAEATEEGVTAEARWIRDTAANILDKFTKPRRMCMRSKRWWNQEITDLRKELGKARRADRDHRTGATRAARRSLRRAIRKAKKACWNNFLENASSEDVWTAVKYTSPRPDDSAKPLISGDQTAITREEKEHMILTAAFPAPPEDNGIIAPPGGKAYERINQSLLGRILASCSNQSAPGEDRMGAEVVKLLREWDPARISTLTKLCIKSGTHPETWKTAKGVVIPKPGKPDYRQVRAHRVISLLDSLGKLVEKTAAHLIADQLERDRSLHEGQYGCRRRRSCVDAVAVLISDAHQAWNRKRIRGALLMDVKSAFNNVGRGHLVDRMVQLGVQNHLVRWTESFMSQRKVRLVLNGQEGEAHEVDTGIPQGSPVSPILFTVYISGLFPLEATVTIEEEAAAALEARSGNRPGLTIFTDGSRLENGATGYAVTWKKGLSWRGHKTHMGWHQEAFDAECAALARALQVAATRTHHVGTVTIFTDAQGGHLEDPMVQNLHRDCIRYTKTLTSEYTAE